MLNIIKVKHDKRDCSSDTSLYLQSSINILNACYFTYSPNEEWEQHLRKSLIISYRVNELEFSRITLAFIFVSQKFKLKLISVKCLLPMIFHNELSITLCTPCWEQLPAELLNSSCVQVHVGATTSSTTKLFMSTGSCWGPPPAALLNSSCPQVHVGGSYQQRCQSGSLRRCAGQEVLGNRQEVGSGEFRLLGRQRRIQLSLKYSPQEGAGQHGSFL